MSHTYEKLSGNKAKLTFTIPAEQFDEAMTQAFLKLRKRINVPGFRKGKAPRKMIETLYGESVFYDDAFEIIFPDAYRAAVEEYDLKPVDQPQIDLDEIGAGKDLKFHLEVFVRPDVTLGDYKGLAVEAELQKLTDEMVDARIEEDRKKASRTSFRRRYRSGPDSDHRQPSVHPRLRRADGRYAAGRGEGPERQVPR